MLQVLSKDRGSRYALTRSNDRLERESAPIVVFGPDTERESRPVTHPSNYASWLMQHFRGLADDLWTAAPAREDRSEPPTSSAT